MAAPFVEGRLRDEPLSIEIRTQCAHCDRKMTIAVGSDLRFEVAQREADPHLFEPRVDWSAFHGPNIIHHY